VRGAPRRVGRDYGLRAHTRAAIQTLAIHSTRRTVARSTAGSGRSRHGVRPTHRPHTLNANTVTPTAPHPRPPRAHARDERHDE
jgi:hypothetical protein